jgi:hypothetical protein
LPTPAPPSHAAPARRASAGKRLGITGTRWLVDGEVYPDALTAKGLAYMRPTPEERDEINCRACHSRDITVPIGAFDAAAISL